MPRLLRSPRLRLVALAALALTPLGAATILLAHAAGPSSYHRAAAILAVVVVAALVVAVLAGEYYLLRPLRRLRHATARMAAGDLSARVPVQPCAAELAKLGACFNTMAEALEAQTARLAHEAAYDGLTGLPNRPRLLRRLDQALGAPVGPADAVAVLFLDLDGFKAVNDRLGHAVGDAVLAAVAQRLQHCMRPPDTVARLGGDEFVVLVEHVLEPAALDRLARRLLDRLARPYAVEGHTIRLGVSIGVAQGSAGHSRPDELLRQADAALLQAKAAGKARAVWFEPSEGAPAGGPLELAQEPRTSAASALTPRAPGRGTGRRCAAAPARRARLASRGGAKR
jgi:diguanylate cyclase (GGDEF)-like protein